LRLLRVMMLVLILRHSIDYLFITSDKAATELTIFFFRGTQDLRVTEDLKESVIERK